jgi:hypothetical protein
MSGAARTPGSSPVADHRHDRLGLDADAATFQLAGADPAAPRANEPGLLRRLAQASPRPLSAYGTS